MGFPPSPPNHQHSEHLLRGERYASCVHAGGLSCDSIIFLYFQLECCTKDDNSAPCCTGVMPNNTSTVPCPCSETTSGGTCWNVIGQYMDQALKLAGGIGLFFSFTEVGLHRNLQQADCLANCGFSTKYLMNSNPNHGRKKWHKPHGTCVQ